MSIHRPLGECLTWILYRDTTTFLKCKLNVSTRIRTSLQAPKDKSGARFHFPDIISSEEWPHYSPDLNPMAYSLWPALNQSLDSLKQSLRREWDRGKAVAPQFYTQQTIRSK